VGLLDRVEVPCFAGIGGQVVELRCGRLDQLPRAGHQRTQRRPAIGEERHQRLGVDGARGRGVRGRSAEQSRREVGAVAAQRARVGRRAEQRERGGGEVDLAHRLRHPQTRAHPRPDDDPRHAQGGVVGEHAVARLAVLAEALAVVGDRHHQQGVAGRRAPQSRMSEQAADLGVDERDLAVVGTTGELAREPRRRRVGGVRIEEMDPEEEGSRAVELVEPSQRAADGGVGAALRHHAELLGPTALEIVVVDLEPLGQTEAAVEHRRRHERGGAIAAPAQRLGQRGGVVAESVQAVVADAVRRRIAAGQHRGVRRQRDRRRGIGALEAGPPSRQLVERRGARVAVTVGADAIGARGVERDQDEGRLDRDGGLPSAAAERDRDAGEPGRRREADQATAMPSAAHLTHRAIVSNGQRRAAHRVET
jgi:hypothetical protein